MSPNAADQPDVVLLATLHPEAEAPGLCGVCLREQTGPRTWLVLYADVRPAALQRTRQQLAQVSTLLCRYYAQHQKQGKFIPAARTLLCPPCVELELIGLGLPYNAITRMQEPEPGADAADMQDRQQPTYGVFLHFVDVPGGEVLPVLVSLPEGTTLGEELTIEREHGFPHPSQQGKVLL